MLLQSMAPDLAEEMCRRALVLERVAALQPVGRRQLAARLNMPEREVRRLAGALRDEGLIGLDASGMTLASKAEAILAPAREFSRSMRGLTALEAELSKLLRIPRVYIAAGNVDEDAQVLCEVGRLAALKIKAFVQNGQTLAVTGGSTMAQVAKHMPSGAPMNIMVVPARGGIGRAMETQANTLVAEIARKLGGHHRLMHLPDQVDQTALNEMIRLPEIRETVELIQRADVILNGIGRADVMAVNRRLDPEIHSMLVREGAVAEAFGCFFNKDGSILYNATCAGVDLNALSPGCSMIAVAAGKHKAEAMAAVLRRYRHVMLITDESAAKEIIRLLAN